MRRKVIQIAESTQLISLPRKWALKYNIKKGEELEIEENTFQLGYTIMGEGEIGTIVLEGAFAWPIDDLVCLNCPAYFAGNPTVLATGTSHFTLNGTLNTWGNSYNGKLETPGGDPVSLAIMSLPMYGLYELSIIFGRRIVQRR